MINTKTFLLKGLIDYRNLKRFFDLFFSIIALIILLPLFIIISIFIKFDSKGNIIYKHQRLGKDKKIIYIYKFRTMVSNSDELFKKFTKEQKEEYERNFKLINDPRVTKFGKILRRTSLDELPQLLNIIKGEMSFVGPRPIVVKELEKYGKNKELLLSVTPGLTGWWACSGRSDITYKERMDLELYYVKNISFKLDIICLLRSLISVINKKGAN